MTSKRSKPNPHRRRPGEVRDAIKSVLDAHPGGASISAIESGVKGLIGNTPSSSVRSYLRLNSSDIFRRASRGVYILRDSPAEEYGSPPAVEKKTRIFSFGSARLVETDCFEWFAAQSRNSIHAVVTDPPYGLVEYRPDQQQKLRQGKGGVWRIPPSFDGVRRSPIPRFTVLSPGEIEDLGKFFLRWGRALLPILVPGANVIVASNPLLSYVVSGSLAKAGLERRGELVRLVMTMRGGDRPKAAHEEFPGISVMPRSMWEPWLIFRKPLEGRVQDNLRKWGTGGFRRPSDERPFGDVIASAPTHASERGLAPHPSLKPQAFLRTVVRGALPLAKGVVLDPFAGSGSTLAAAEAVGYESVGLEMDPKFFEIGTKAIPRLAAFKKDTVQLFSL